VHVKNVERAVQTFAALWCKFCRLIAQVLLCFTVLCKIFEVQYKSLLHFSRGGGCKSLSFDSLLLSKN